VVAAFGLVKRSPGIVTKRNAAQGQAQGALVGLVAEGGG
jgi:hypothetical protein